MKRIVLFITAVLLFAGCAKEQLVDERSYNGPVTVVKATFESLTDGATKAAVTEIGTFTWQNGDKAAFTAASGSSYYTGTNSSTSATANFTIYDAPTFTSSSFAFYPSDLTTGKSTSSLAVTVPATREWVNDQTNVAMYGVKVENEASFNFSHMGGLVRVRVNNVPTNARKFVFKTPDYKISGDFTVEEESGYKVIKTKTHETENPVSEIEQTYTLTWTTAPATENIMDFYIPLPLGTYANGFAFKFLDGEGAEILSKTSSQSETIARTDLVLMPSITLMGGEIEPVETAAVVANIPAGYSGDFLLPQSEKVLLKINASSVDHDITLKYDGGSVPTNLEIKVINGDNAGNYDAKLLGNLPSTHVEFTQGHIDATELTTSSSTFAVVNPASVGTLTVKGGNVKIEGATVNTIVVAENAVASKETKAPVEIVVEKSSSEETFTAPAVTANANVIVAPASGVSVNVTANGDAKVANAGEGEVSGTPLTTAQARIDDINYFTLADAVKAAPANATEATTITLLENVTDGAGIFLAAADKKNIIIDLNDKTYTASTPVGSAGTVNQAFHLEKGNTIIIQNGTLNVDVNKKTDFRFIIQNYADLTLEGVTLDGSNLAKTDKVCYTVSNNSGAVEFKDFGDIKTNIIAPDGGVAFDVCKYASYEVPTVTWNSAGTVTGGIELSGGNFVVAANLAANRPIVAVDDKDVQSVSSTLTINSGATISTASTFQDLTPGISGPGVTSLVQVRRGADLTIDGAGSIEAGAQTYSAVMVTVNNDNDEKTAILTVNGQVTITGDYYGIVGNGNRHNTKITVNGGTIKGTHDNDNHGIYHPQNGSLTINGESTQIIGYNNGIEMRAGNLVVNNGTIIGTATNTTVVPNGNGSTTKGAGIAIAKHTTNLPISVTINKGTIIGAQAISNANPQNVDAEVTVVINGGTFSDESAIKYAATNADITIKLQADRTAGTGVFVTADQNQNITFDLNGYDYVGVGPAVGSTGTSNQLFHIEKGNTFTLKNSDSNQGGTVSIASGAANLFRFIIQNYADLTLENVTIDGTGLSYNNDNKGYTYALSNNCGNVYLNGTTSIKASTTSELNNYAFDVCKYSDYDAPTVTWNSEGSVTGIIELSGGTFKLDADLCVNAPVYVTSSNKSTLNLNGKKIHNIYDIWEKDSAKEWGELIRVDGGKLEINDAENGSVAAKANDCYAVNVRENGELTINGGTFKGNVSAVQVDKGTATINAGSFEQQQTGDYGDKFLLNCVDANYQAGTAKIIVKGGSFTRFNPADNAAEGAGTNFVASGYTSTETSTGVWTVSATQN